jgi:hypothetical protein
MGGRNGNSRSLIQTVLPVSGSFATLAAIRRALFLVSGFSH